MLIILINGVAALNKNCHDLESPSHLHMEGIEAVKVIGLDGCTTSSGYHAPVQLLVPTNNTPHLIPFAAALSTGTVFI